MDALRGQIQRCWNVPAGAADAQNIKVSVQFKLTQNGALDGSPTIVSGGGSAGIERAAAESARRAVLRRAQRDIAAEVAERLPALLDSVDRSVSQARLELAAAEAARTAVTAELAEARAQETSVRERLAALTESGMPS